MTKFACQISKPVQPGSLDVLHSKSLTQPIFKLTRYRNSGDLGSGSGGTNSTRSMSRDLPVGPRSVLDLAGGHCCVRQIVFCVELSHRILARHNFRSRYTVVHGKVHPGPFGSHTNPRTGFRWNFLASLNFKVVIDPIDNWNNRPYS